MAKLRGQLVLLSFRYTWNFNTELVIHSRIKSKNKGTVMVKTDQNMLLKRKKLKGGDLRNSGVQLRLLESKGRVSGSGHYRHYGATAIVKSAYNQNTESHILLELTAVFWTEWFRVFITKSELLLILLKAKSGQICYSWRYRSKGKWESEEGYERFPMEENSSKAKTELQIMVGQNKLFIYEFFWFAEWG